LAFCWNVRVKLWERRALQPVGGAGFAVPGPGGKEALNQSFAFHLSVLTDGWFAVGRRQPPKRTRVARMIRYFRLIFSLT
jgi:hypothetical protein